MNCIVNKELFMKTNGTKIIFFFSILCIPLLLLTEPEITTDEKSQSWEEAEKAFIQFITPDIERLREKLKNPHIDYAEIRDELITKYLPDYKFYVINSTLGSSSRIFLLEQSGKIHSFGFGDWISIDEEGRRFRSAEITEFLKERKIKIENKESAIEIAKLIEEMLNAPNFIYSLRRQTKNFRVFDRQFLAKAFSKNSNWMYFNNSNWKYTAEKISNGWKVSVEYVGPPACIQEPPIYEIEVDKDNLFINIVRM